MYCMDNYQLLNCWQNRILFIKCFCKFKFRAPVINVINSIMFFVFYWTIFSLQTSILQIIIILIVTGVQKSEWLTRITLWRGKQNIFLLVQNFEEHNIYYILTSLMLAVFSYADIKYHLFSQSYNFIWYLFCYWYFHGIFIVLLLMMVFVVFVPPGRKIQIVNLASWPAWMILDWWKIHH